MDRSLTEIVLRVTDHPITKEAEHALRRIYGEEIEIITVRGGSFGGDILSIFQGFFKDIELVSGIHDRIIAVELVAPHHIKAVCLNYLNDIRVDLIQAIPPIKDGKPVQTGLDKNGVIILKFDYYVRIHGYTVNFERM